MKSFIIFVVILAGLLLPQQLLLPNLEHSLQFMKDNLGRSILWVSWSAAANTISKVLVTYLIIILCSAVFSILTHSLQTRLKNIISSIMNSFLTLPSLLIGIILAAKLGPGPRPLLFASLLTCVPSLWKLFSARLASLAQEDYFQSSLALGSRKFISYWKHGKAPILDLIGAQTPLYIVKLTMLEASLSFLGATTNESESSLGQLIFEARDYLIEAPWIMITSGFFLFICLFSPMAGKKILK